MEIIGFIITIVGLLYLYFQTSAVARPTTPPQPKKERSVEKARARAETHLPLPPPVILHHQSSNPASLLPVEEAHRKAARRRYSTADRWRQAVIDREVIGPPKGLSS